MNQTRRGRINFGLDRFSGLYIWALFIVTFSIWAPSLFPTRGTADSIASGQAVTGLLALAVLVPLVTGTYDLSIGSVANLSAILAINLQVAHHVALPIAIVLAVLAGIVIGLVNGFVVVRLKVNSFIATLGMGSIVLALLTMVTGNIQPQPPASVTWTNLTQYSVGGFQIAFFYLLAVALVVWWVLQYTPVGRYMFAIGSNPEAARLSGIPVGRWIWVSLACSGGLAAIAGVVFGSLLGPSLTFGQGLLLPAFAAVFLGSTQLRPGRFNVWGTVIAIYVLATGVQGFQYVTGVQWLSDMFNGVALVAAVAFAVWRQSAATRRKSRRTGQIPDDHVGSTDRRVPDEEVPHTDSGPLASLDSEGELGSPLSP